MQLIAMEPVDLSNNIKNKQINYSASQRKSMDQLRDAVGLE